MRFIRGDRVQITKDLGASMSHFPGAGQTAIVIYSYGDRYGGDSHSSLCLMFADGSEVSWYYDWQLTLLGRVTENDIHEIVKMKEAKIEQHRDLKWISEHWSDKGMPGSSLQAISDLCGLGSLWGRYGEGIDYYTNSLWIMNAFNDVATKGVDAIKYRAEEIKRGSRAK